MEAEAGLAHFINLRAELSQGDYRLLYLTWLKAMTFAGEAYDEEDEYDDPDILDSSREPPVPSCRKKAKQAK